MICAEAVELLHKLWKGRGGFIAACYNDNASIGLEPVWQEYACNEFITRGTREHWLVCEEMKSICPSVE